MKSGKFAKRCARLERSVNKLSDAAKRRTLTLDQKNTLKTVLQRVLPLARQTMELIEPQQGCSPSSAGGTPPDMR